MERRSRGPVEQEKATFDWIVVGGGAAGAVLARRLADSGKGTVALIEAGPPDENRPEVLDLRRYREVVEGPLRWPIRSLARPGRRTPVPLPVARLLGGCSSHNSCIWFRPPDLDFRLWREAGATGWAPEDVAGAFDWLESRIAIETARPDGAAHRALIEAARQSGFAERDFARPFGEGIGRYRLSRRNHRRQSSSVVFLHPLSALPPTLALFTDTEIDRLVIEGGRVVGAAAGARIFRARREVVLSAGAFGSPRLLMLSGIGPGPLLQRLGIAVQRDLPGVGRHLLDHPACAINWQARRPPDRDPDWNYAGVLFARCEAAAEWPDIEIQLAPEPFTAFTAPEGYPSPAAGFCAYLTVNRARSEGTVTLASPDPREPPAVDPGFFTDPAGHDMRVMLAGLRLARRLFAAPALAPWIGEEAAPGSECAEDDAFARFVERTHTTGYHPAGTCRMGAADDPRAVATPELRAKGLDGLRIADASVFPTMVSVNIAAACMMIGVRCADLILGEA